MADESDKIDLERLRQQNAPLAKTLSMLVDSGTRRDSNFQIAEDLSLGIFARDESTELGAAFKELEDSIPGELTAEGRKDLQRRLQQQLGEAGT